MRVHTIGGLAVVAALAAATLSAPAASASWQTQHCVTNAGAASTMPTKLNSIQYADTAVGDGYQWGGSCWVNDGVDATPNDPPGTYSGGEGPDCSGLIGKAWYLEANPALTTAQRWNYNVYFHPVDTSAIKAGSSGGWAAIGGRTYDSMEGSNALVRDDDGPGGAGHVMQLRFKRSNGTVNVTEAKSEAVGTVHSDYTIAYLQNNNYLARQRNGLQD